MTGPWRGWPIGWLGGVGAPGLAQGLMARLRRAASYCLPELSGAATRSGRRRRR